MSTADDTEDTEEPLFANSRSRLSVTRCYEPGLTVIIEDPSCGCREMVYRFMIHGLKYMCDTTQRLRYIGTIFFLMVSSFIRLFGGMNRAEAPPTYLERFFLKLSHGGTFILPLVFGVMVGFDKHLMERVRAAIWLGRLGYKKASRRRGSIKDFWNAHHSAAAFVHQFSRQFKPEKAKRNVDNPDPK